MGITSRQWSGGNEIDREQALRELSELLDGDPEGNHFDADRVLCELLTALGYGDIVEAYDKVQKWYS